MQKSRESSALSERAGKNEKGMKPKKNNFSDIPELSAMQLSRMRRVGRLTAGDEARKLIAIRLDAKVLDWLCHCFLNGLNRLNVWNDLNAQSRSVPR
jgi:uncharacterized protein (DUF4415 family)